MIIFKNGVPLKKLADFMPEQNITNKGFEVFTI